MSTLAINRGILGQFLDSRYSLHLLFLSISFFIPLLPKLSFSRIPPNLSKKNDDLGPIHHWIIMKFEHQVPNSFPNILMIGNYENMSKLREIPLHLSFFFSRRNLKLSQWNYDSGLVNCWIIVKFWYMVRDSFPHIFTVGICKKTSLEVEISSHVDSGMETLILSPSL